MYWTLLLAVRLDWDDETLKSALALPDFHRLAITTDRHGMERRLASYLGESFWFNWFRL